MNNISPGIINSIETGIVIEVTIIVIGVIVVISSSVVTSYTITSIISCIVDKTTGSYLCKFGFNLFNDFLRVFVQHILSRYYLKIYKLMYHVYSITISDWD